MKLLQHIPGQFQECCYNVAAKRCKKHLHNSMATFIDNVEVLCYSQCCGNLSAIWENPRRKYQDKMDEVKSDAHIISLVDFMFHLR